MTVLKDVVYSYFYRIFQKSQVHEQKYHAKLGEIGCAPDFLCGFVPRKQEFRFTTCPFQRHGYYLMV